MFYIDCTSEYNKWYGEIITGVCPRLEIIDFMQISCLWCMTFVVLMHLSFYAILLIVFDVMYDITTTHWLRSARNIWHVFVLI